MFSATRSSRNSGPSKPCPCGGVCDCHRPEPSYWVGFAILLAAPVLLVVVTLAFPSKPAPRTIHVGGKVCEVRFVKTGISCTATGFCHERGYDEAVCP